MTKEKILPYTSITKIAEKIILVSKNYKESGYFGQANIELNSQNKWNFIAIRKSKPINIIINGKDIKSIERKQILD